MSNSSLFFICNAYKYSSCATETIFMGVTRNPQTYSMKYLIILILLITGCSTTDEVINERPAPKFRERVEVEEDVRRWGLHYRTCTRDYSVLDLLPFRWVVNGIGRVVIDCTAYPIKPEDLIEELES